MPDLTQRASDAEREAVADRLRAAAAQGRLEPDELEERLGGAYAARTTGDLAPLTADLPAAAMPAAPRAPLRQSLQVRRKLAGFIVANVVCIAVWLATGADEGFWPGWVLLGTGIALFSTWVRVALGVSDDDEPPPGIRAR